MSDHQEKFRSLNHEWVPVPAILPSQTSLTKHAHIVSPIEKRDAPLPEQVQATVILLCQHILQMATAAIEHHGFFAWAIPGGTTIHSIFETMEKSSIAANFPWKKTKIFWSDERNLPYDHADSNFGNIGKRLVGLGVPESHIFPIPVRPNCSATDSKIMNEAIQEYEAKIKNELCDGLIDLHLLGMGADGHFASIFPNTSLVDEWTNMPSHAQNFKKYAQTYHSISFNFPNGLVSRITHTVPFILLNSRQIAFCLLDTKKKALLDRALIPGSPLILDDPKNCPSEIFKLLNHSDSPFWFIIPSLL